MPTKTKGKAPSKSQLVAHIADKTGLSKKQVSSVFDELTEFIREQFSRKGPGVFTLPGLVKMKVVEKKAVPAGMRMDPFTKTMRHFEAKPARRVVKALALKNLKEMAMVGRT